MNEWINKQILDYDKYCEENKIVQRNREHLSTRGVSEMTSCGSDF